MSIRDWPIKRKLTAILLLISGLVLVLTSVAFVTYEVVTFRQTIQTHLATRSRILAANSTAALAFANEADATEILAALRYDPHTVAGALYDRNGRVLATYPARAAADLIPGAPEPDGYRFEGGRLVAFTPVAQGANQRLGTLYIASDTKAVSDAIRLSGIIAIVVLAIALLAAYALAAALQGRISAPILALAETATAASTRQDYSLRAPKFGEDELGTLTDAFNQMLGRIEDQKQELQQHATRLEQRVADRTKEHLATSDQGILMLRKMIRDSIDAVQQGKDPIGVIRDPNDNGPITFDSSRDAGSCRRASPIHVCHTKVVGHRRFCRSDPRRCQGFGKPKLHAAK